MKEYLEQREDYNLVNDISFGTNFSTENIKQQLMGILFKTGTLNANFLRSLVFLESQLDNVLEANKSLELIESRFNNVRTSIDFISNSRYNASDNTKAISVVDITKGNFKNTFYNIGLSGITFDKYTSSEKIGEVQVVINPDPENPNNDPIIQFVTSNYSLPFSGGIFNVEVQRASNALPATTVKVIVPGEQELREIETNPYYIEFEYNNGTQEVQIDLDIRPIGTIGQVIRFNKFPTNTIGSNDGYLLLSASGGGFNYTNPETVVASQLTRYGVAIDPISNTVKVGISSDTEMLWVILTGSVISFTTDIEDASSFPFVINNYNHYLFITAGFLTDSVDMDGSAYISIFADDGQLYRPAGYSASLNKDIIKFSGNPTNGTLSDNNRRFTPSGSASAFAAAGDENLPTEPNQEITLEWLSGDTVNKIAEIEFTSTIPEGRSKFIYLADPVNGVIGNIADCELIIDPEQ